jgi:AcrR family transcriptional regulator
MTSADGGEAMRQERGGGREAKILAAATTLFYGQGYSHTSVEDVARAVGVLKSSLYYYIDSKEDLLVRILEEVHEEVAVIVDDVVAHAELDPLERLSLYVRRQVDYNARNVRKIAVYYHEFSRFGGPRLAGVRRQRRQHEQFLVELIEEAAASGQLPSGLDARLAARAIFATMIWPYTWYRADGDVSAPALADFCVAFVLEGVRAGGAGAWAPGGRRSAPRR